MPEIWTISLTATGIGACALDTDGQRRSFSAPWPPFIKHNIRAIEPEAPRRLIAHALEALQVKARALPLAIGISSPDRETAAFMDAHGDMQLPIFTDPPIVVPRRDVPDKYECDGALVTAYRQSVLRGLQTLDPGLAVNTHLGLYSLGAVAARWLTGSPASSSLPLGVPEHFPAFENMPQDMFFSALGVSRDLSMKRARCGHLVGKIRSDIVQSLRAFDMPELSELAGIPVFDMGSSNAGRAYASAADPFSWSVTLGTDLRAHWTAGVTALSAYELTVRDQPDAQQDTNAPEIKEMTADEWTRAWHDVLPLSVEPGPGAERACFGFTLPSIRASLFAHAFEKLGVSATVPLDIKTLQQSPVGSHGLHVIFDQQYARIVGLCAAHDDCDLARAAFEGMCYALKAYRERLDHGADGPIRLILEQPWPQACAQWVADILDAKAYLIAEDEAALAAFGICLALMRLLEIPLAERPAMQATIIEPGTRCAYYARHYRIHCMLCDNQT